MLYRVDYTIAVLLAGLLAGLLIRGRAARFSTFRLGALVLRRYIRSHGYQSHNVCLQPAR
jgi:hypothetical protein